MTLQLVGRAQERGSGCEVQASGAIDLYFYDDLSPEEREAVVMEEQRQNLAEVRRSF